MLEKKENTYDDSNDTFVAVASAQNVTYNFDQAADFSKFKSYKWVEIPGGVKLDDITARQLTSALEAKLAQRG